MYPLDGEAVNCFGISTSSSVRPGDGSAEFSATCAIYAIRTSWPRTRPLQRAERMLETRGSRATTETILQKLRYVAGGLRCRVSLSLVRRVKYNTCERPADGCYHRCWLPLCPIPETRWSLVPDCLIDSKSRTVQLVLADTRMILWDFKIIYIYIKFYIDSNSSKRESKSK
jgi:hypothetical protein